MNQENFIPVGKNLHEKQRSLDKKVETLLYRFSNPTKIITNSMICASVRDMQSFHSSEGEDGQIGFWHNIPLFLDENMLFEDSRIVTDQWELNVVTDQWELQ